MSDEKTLEQVKQERIDRVIKELTEKGFATVRAGKDRVFYFSTDILLMLLAKAEDAESDHVSVLIQDTSEDEDEVTEFLAEQQGKN